MDENAGPGEMGMEGWRLTVGFAAAAAAGGAAVAAEVEIAAAARLGSTAACCPLPPVDLRVCSIWSGVVVVVVAVVAVVVGLAVGLNFTDVSSFKVGRR